MLLKLGIIEYQVLSNITENEVEVDSDTRPMIIKDEHIA